MVIDVSSTDRYIQRSLDRSLEEAYLYGELKLSGRKLKDFPKISFILHPSTDKYNVHDIVIADLSKNRFTDMPVEITEFFFLEKLYLFNNAIKTIPKNVCLLESLTFLDLSRNQLTMIPEEICRLPLQTLLVAYNKIITLPEDLKKMSILAELNVSCNKITNLPPEIDKLSQLKFLDLKSNHLMYFPIELTYLKLKKLDISENKISILPKELSNMKTLIDLRLSDNPLTSPPAALCTRGRMHIFKYLDDKYEQFQNDKLNSSSMIFQSQSYSSIENLSIQKKYYFDETWPLIINNVVSLNAENLIDINCTKTYEKETPNQFKSELILSSTDNYQETNEEISRSYYDHILSSFLLTIFILTLSLLHFCPIPT